MSTQTVDILIVGGGVMGSAIAYNLRKKNPTVSVIVVERDPSYEKSSTVLSDGNARVQFNIKENIEISLYGMQVLETFADAFATKAHTPLINFHRQGNIFVVDDEIGKEAALQGLAYQNDLGAKAKWIEPDEIAAMHPLFNPNSCLGATYGPKDGTMSPLDVLLGYRRKAIELGAQFVQAEVQSLLAENGQMSGAKLTSGDTILANKVVNAAGPWAGKLAATAGVNLPVISIKRQVYSIEIDEKYEHILPMMLLPTGQYCLHEGGGHFVTGGALPSDPETYDDFSWSHERFEEHLWEKLIRFFPNFDRLKLVNGWSGYYAVNQLDGNAILGEWPELDGLFLINGFSGHGFQQSHAVGRYLAELLLEETPFLDLSIFSPQRILNHAPVFENPLRII